MGDLHLLVCKWRPIAFIVFLGITQIFYLASRHLTSRSDENTTTTLPLVINLEKDLTSTLNAATRNDNLYPVNNPDFLHVRPNRKPVRDMSKYMLTASLLPVVEEIMLDNKGIIDTFPTETEVRGIFHYENVGFNTYMLNATAAQELRIDVTVGKTQPTLCINKTYPSLPLHDIKVSIIIPFHHELWVVLVRCLYGIIKRSTFHLIHEIILIDDRSEQANLRGPLVQFLHKVPKVRLLRSEEREGLIRARMAAARKATGNILIFMDAHVEVSHGWMEPLLEVIIKDRNAVAIPTVDYINPKTMEYHYVYYRTRGSFGWELDYVWKDESEDIFYDRDVKPFKSGTMIGCVFAVDRESFFEFGGYDESMRIWGGENLEIAFRTWMCGGSLMVVPCSHVGHIYRAILPYNFTQATLYQNLQRVADVWMDDYKEIYFRASGHEFIFNRQDTEAMQLRHQLRTDLKCKDFKWYLENVTPEVVVPDNDAEFFGQLRNLGSRFCLSVNETSHDLYFDYCTLYDRHQAFTYTTDNQIKHNFRCLIYDQMERKVKLEECADKAWFYDYTSISIVNFDKKLVGVDKRKPYAMLEWHSGNTCLSKDGNKINSTLTMEHCDPNNPFHYWIFTHKFNKRRS